MNFSLLEIRVVACQWQLFPCLTNSVAKQRHRAPRHSTHALLIEEKVVISPFPTPSCCGTGQRSECKRQMWHKLSKELETG